MALCSPRIRRAFIGISNSGEAEAMQPESHTSAPTSEIPKSPIFLGASDPKVCTKSDGTPSAESIEPGSSRLSTRTVSAEKIFLFAAAYFSIEPCQSIWSSVMFKSAALSQCRLSVVSSWKLDSSSTQKSGSVPARRCFSSSPKAFGPTLPAATTDLPASAMMAVESIVVVVLPLVPVMPMIFGA